MNKKAYFFIMDGIFALMILMIGFLILTSSRHALPDETMLTAESENIMDVLADVKINDLCDVDTCTCSVQALSDLCDGGDIHNFDQLLMDYFGELFYRYDAAPDSLKSDIEQDINSLFRGLTEDLYRTDLYGIRLVIEDHGFYSDANPEQSKILYSSKKIVFGYYDQNTPDVDVVFWGPYILEVDLWKK